MKKIVVFVLGPDRPGIIATVSKTLFEHGCNLEDVSQTILQTEFIGIFIASIADSVYEEDLLNALWENLDPLGLFAHLTPLNEAAAVRQTASVPFVITTFGPDKPGLVAGITDVLARHNVNITNLKAVARGAHREEYVMFYEVDIPAGVDQHAFREALYGRARDLGLDCNLQHREIFEEIHRL